MLGIGQEDEGMGRVCGVGARFELLLLGMCCRVDREGLGVLGLGMLR